MQIPVPASPDVGCGSRNSFILLAVKRNKIVFDRSGELRS